MNSEVLNINNVEIQCPEKDGVKFVAVKPLCTVMGISHDAQNRRIKSDEILSSVATTVVATGSDGKSYEMTCLPLKFVFGWLFSIDDKLVKGDARINLLAYKRECYEILFDTFFNRAKHYEKRDQIINSLQQEMIEAENDRKDAANRVKTIREKIESVRKTPLNQLDLFDVKPE